MVRPGDGSGETTSADRKTTRRALLRVLIPVLRWLVHLALVIFLCQQLYSQYEVYCSQPVTTTIQSRLAPFPRITLQVVLDSAKKKINLEILLKVPPIFSSETLAYRLYVHDTEEPNIGELLPNELGRVQQTVSVDMLVQKNLSMRLTARLFNSANVWRRPCREEPGYSAIQCLKECLWHRLAANISCRLPHMVGAGVYLPDMSGPLDHLPLCTRPVQMYYSKNKYKLRFCESINKEQCIFGNQ
ncbi:hypothetical protein FJT64_012128 [Amphibalanus amphitrite]|uniref:Uncharacterized protein n=1 Tax=Amphibalanus amphitrite TaxID=1232801 RepID=A0A6A4V0I4_AMPAM|nr:hypothetical protein FJT64_012128 [Amphibalanus amphitrite]